MTVLESIQKSAEFLQKKGVESPRLQAELLLAHLLGLERMKLYLNFERTLAPTETDRFREMVRRRGAREPLQHITGSTCFCGFEIAVNPHVLVPRPETELLAEAGWNFLSTAGSQARALDFGTGSGCIAIALAAKCPDAKILALEASSAALEIACRNALQNGVAGQIEFLQGTSVTAVQQADPSLRFELVISNPPYIPSAEIETLEPEVRDHDPRAALDGGPDGLEFFRMLAGGAKPLLKPGGKLMVEFGDGQAKAIREIVEAQNWIVEAVREDYNQRPRILIAKI